MTTQINIVVDDGGLIQRNREQTDGNRWLTLEKNGQKLTASKSKEMRDQELAKQGKAPDGKPQSTAPAKPSFRRDEPAAQRQQATTVGHVWTGFTAQNTPMPGPKWGVQWFGESYTGSAYYNTELLSLGSSITHSLLPGRGTPNVAIAIITTSADTEYPTDDLFWKYTIEFEKIGSFWFVSAKGNRTGAVSRGLGSPTVQYAYLPAGGRNCIVIAFARQAGSETDCTALCGTPSYSVSGNAELTPSDIAYGESLINSIYGGGDFGTQEDVYGGPPATMTLVNSVSYRSTTAWIVSDKAVRQVTPPAYFDSYNPPIGTTEVGFSYSNKVSVPVFGNPPFINVPTPYQIADPSIYESLNQLKQFVDPAAIKQFYGTAASMVQRDATKGAFQNPGNATELFDQNQPFYYRYKRKGQNAFAQIQTPQLQLDPNRTVGKPDQIESLMSVYDGGDPNYCRQMLLAMGFTAADLSTTPPTP